MAFVLPDGRRITIRPHDWLGQQGMDQQPNREDLKWLPAAATPIGQALHEWSSVAWGGESSPA